MDSTFVADSSLGYRQVLAATVDAGTTLSPIPKGTSRVVIQAEAQAVRWRDDGVNASTTVGMLLPAGGTLEYKDNGLPQLGFISATAGAILNITFYGTR
jgi:hypothetical protein